MESPHPVRADDLEWVLGYLATGVGGSRLVRESPLRTFEEYLRVCAVQWVGWYLGAPRQARELFFALLMPGRTAILLRPASPTARSHTADAEELLRFALGELTNLRLHYAQVLLDTTTAHDRPLLEQVGFRALARLVYLERATCFPWVDPPDAAGEWVAFDETRREEFERMIAASDEESLDCPGLTGLRPPSDVLRAHQAAGEFDPHYWEILRIDGAPVGCILLSRMPWAGTMEIVYVGVARAYRRRGFGSTLLRRAVQHSRAARVERIMVVVDDGNGPAKRLYERFGFTPVAQRDALLYRWDGGATVGKR